MPKTLKDLGMTQERYTFLNDEESANVKLTQDEIQAGWHFCPEWDYLLTNLKDPDGECCSCDKNWAKKEREAKQ